METLKLFNPSALKFAPQAKLDQKMQMSVKVCYVFSTNEFYIQSQESKVILDYDMLYYELQQQMTKAPALQKLQVGLCCGIQIDGEWFRGQIVGIKQDIVSVQVIDFGIVEEVSAKSIRMLTTKFFDAPPFAYRCCLKGFENTEVSDNINTQFDIFCSDGKGERRVFKMLVEEFKFDKGYIVELEDESVVPPANVNRLLLKNSRPLAETITLENAKKRQKEAAIKEPAPKESPDRNRASSQRGRGNHKGVQRSSPATETNDKRQRTHFGKQNEKEESDAFYKSLKEATSSDKKAATKLNTSNSSSSFESNWREGHTQENSKNRKSKSPKTPDKKQKSPIKREKSTVDEKAATKRVEKPVSNIKCGWVSALSSINKAYVHLEEHLEGLERLLNGMYNFYSKSQNPLQNIVKGTICAFLSGDQNWFRGEIKEIKGETCMVYNLEYGNMETTHKRNIYELVEQFAREDRFLVEAYFAIKPVESDEKLRNEMESFFSGGSVELKFDIVKGFKNGFIMEILDLKNENFFDKLVAKKVAVRISEEALAKTLNEQENASLNFDDVLSESTLTSEAEEDIPEKETLAEVKANLVQGKITAITSPNDFYLTSLDALGNFKELHNDIQCFASAMSPLLGKLNFLHLKSLTN